MVMKATRLRRISNMRNRQFYFRLSLPIRLKKTTGKKSRKKNDRHGASDEEIDDGGLGNNLCRHLYYKYFFICSAFCFPTISSNSSNFIPLILAIVPNFCFRSFFVLGPMPGIVSSADLVACLLRKER